ncbi:OmpA/MotB family protein [Calorimonas adulescens]|jgi:OmpA family.|uniref:OmpA family protein n=1 Tax=Calorimonas adulescens TaxID=2606906 RepID=A0A5D8QG20_9THEO|nr:OmpA family protein [Calorimonas adulescens]TZE83347.1 OmpA family protein [Calorimonas adulescens]
MSRKGRRSKNDDGPQDSKEWMNTYADLMSLLLTFFVMIFSLSTIDMNKYQALIQSLQGYLGIVKEGHTLQNTAAQLETQGSAGSNVAATNTNFEDIADVYNDIQTYIEQSNLSNSVQVTINERGILIRFVDTALFDTGKADIKPEAKEILKNVGEIIKRADKPIRVEGHTDNVPIHNEKFPSNWELSTARATNVVKYFIENVGMDPSTLSAAGYGEYHPVADNQTEEGRAKNRRVDIIIVNGSSNK